jgi:hypothetical protein
MLRKDYDCKGRDLEGLQLQKKTLVVILKGLGAKRSRLAVNSQA